MRKTMNTMIVVSLLAVGCDDDNDEGGPIYNDAGIDASVGVDGGRDAALDAALDAARDAARDGAR